MRVRLTLIAAIAAILAVAGCAQETRYKTLSFFFDGVPEPGQEHVYVVGGRRIQQKVTTGQFRSHGPFAAKMCNACHQRDGSNKLILPVEKLCLNCHDLNLHTRKQHGPVVSGGCRVCHNPHGSGKPFLLVAEPTTFCFYCHDQTEVMSHDVHRDSGGMQCTECHNPHGSDNDYLLK